MLRKQINGGLVTAVRLQHKKGENNYGCCY